MDLFGDLARLRDLVVAPLAPSFGLPYVRSLIIAKRSGQGIQYLEILPVPHVKKANAQLIEIYGKASVKVELDDYQVSGISKAYREEQLVGSGVSYLLDATLVDGVVVGGIECNRVVGTVLGEFRNAWTLMLRRRQKP